MCQHIRLTSGASPRTTDDLGRCAAFGVSAEAGALKVEVRDHRTSPPGLARTAGRGGGKADHRSPVSDGAVQPGRERHLEAEPALHAAPRNRLAVTLIEVVRAEMTYGRRRWGK